MGRIKTKLTKGATLRLFGQHGDRFTDKFEENKKVVAELAEIPSKKLRNIIAGYATRLARTRE